MTSLTGEAVGSSEVSLFSRCRQRQSSWSVFALSQPCATAVASALHCSWEHLLGPKIETVPLAFLVPYVQSSCTFTCEHLVKLRTLSSLAFAVLVSFTFAFAVWTLTSEIAGAGRGVQNRLGS